MYLINLYTNSTCTCKFISVIKICLALWSSIISPKSISQMSLLGFSPWGAFRLDIFGWSWVECGILKWYCRCGSIVINHTYCDFICVTTPTSMRRPNPRAIKISSFSEYIKWFATQLASVRIHCTNLISHKSKLRDQWPCRRLLDITAGVRSSRSEGTLSSRAGLVQKVAVLRHPLASTRKVPRARKQGKSAVTCLTIHTITIMVKACCLSVIKR